MNQQFHCCLPYQDTADQTADQGEIEAVSVCRLAFQLTLGQQRDTGEDGLKKSEQKIINLLLNRFESLMKSFD